MSAACVLSAVLSWPGALNAQTDADWGWMNEHFGPVFDALMPPRRQGGVYISYRANRDFVTGTPEYWFMIGREPSEKGYGLNPYLTAHARLADPASIYDQLMTMHRAEPAAPDTTLQSGIKLRKYDFTEKTCPAIKDQIDKLKSIPARVPEINGDYIVLHPMIHAFHISGADGDATLVLTDEKNPLVQWAEETRRMLEACGKLR